MPSHNQPDCVRFAARPVYRIGAGVWLSKLINGERAHVPAVVIGYNRLTRCWLVAPEATPMRGHLVGPDRIMPRYAGEACPGRQGAAP